MPERARARAGGLELPDDGTEALGRGGAFTAKADDPRALVHNVAGLAQLAGTHAQIDADVWSPSPRSARARDPTEDELKERSE